MESLYDDQIYIPTVLVNAEEIIDTDLIDRVWSIHHKARPAKRSLAKELLPHSKFESIAQAYSEIVIETKLFARWFSPDLYKDRSLSWLAKRYAFGENHELKYEKLEVLGFLKKRKDLDNRYFFQLEKIDLFLDVIKEHSGHPESLGLYLWAMIVEARHAAVKYPQEKSFLLFEELLKKGLEDRGLNELCGLIQPASLAPKKAEGEKRGDNEKCEKLVPLVEISDAELLLADELKSRSVCLRKLEEHVFEVRMEVQGLNSKVSALCLDESLPAGLAALNNQIVLLGEEASRTINELKAFAEKLEADINNKAQFLGLKLTPLNVELKFDKPSTWFQELEVRTNALFKLEKILCESSELEFDEWDKKTTKEPLHCESDEIIEWAERNIKELRESKQVSDYYYKFTEIVKSKHQELSWVAFDDVDITPNMWDGVFKYFSNNYHLHPLIGITAYRDFLSKKSYLAQQLRDSLSGDKDELKACLNVLSCLNAGQLENLARECSDLKIPICLVLLEGFLSATEMHRPGFEFWSVYPLSEAYVSNNSSAAKEFFSALFWLAAQESSHLNYQSLRLSVSAAKTIRLDDRTESLAELELQLSETLQHRRKGGGVTYIQIWEAAYDEVLRPLNEVYTASGIQEFFFAYRQWLPTFDIDKSIEGWKSEIPEHLKKNSVYDKFIRTQLQLKLGELELLEKMYESLLSPSKDKGDILQKLKESVGLILKSVDKESVLIKNWLADKARDVSPLFNPYVSPSLSLSPDEETCLLENVSVHFPRTFSSVGLGPVGYKEIYSDLIVSALGMNGPETLVNIYLKEGVVEACNKILSDSYFTISPDIERLAERRIEEITAAVEERAEELSRFLAIDCGGELRVALLMADKLLHDGLVRRAQIVLERAAKIVETLKSNEIELKLRSEILIKLEYLQDKNFSESLNAAELTKYYLERLEENLDRRKHILVLQRLLKVNEWGIADRVSKCITALESYGRYPDPVTSECVAFYWEQAVDPLLRELKRSRTLRPDYLDKLLQLAYIFCDCLNDDFEVVREDSKLNQMLLSTAENWASLPDLGTEAADEIIDKFEIQGLVTATEEPKEFPIGGASLVESLAQDGAISNQGPLKIVMLMEAARAWSLAHPASQLEKAELTAAIESHDWALVQEVSSARLLQSGFTNQEELENWTISSALLEDSQLDIFILAHALSFITAKHSSQVVRYLYNDRAARSVVERLSISFLMALATNSGWAGAVGDRSATKIIECIQFMLEDIERSIKNKDFFSIGYPAPNAESLVLKLLWDKFSGGQRQAEARALFMLLAWKLRAPETLAFCLTQAPIELDKRKSQALATAADQALASGNTGLLQPFVDLRTRISARPFQILVDGMTRSVIDQSETPAKLNLVSNLEKHSDNIYKAILSIEPRRIDSPDFLQLEIPRNAPVRFAGKTTTLELKGPFLSSASLSVEFEIINQSAYSFELEVSCTAHSITGRVSEFNQTLNFVIQGSQTFCPMSADDIEEAFDYFPASYMRGADYVPRVVDEQKIEKALFKSKTVRSLWITSPRRSGKTSMLFRILDGYSHKAGRDNLVVYLTLDEYYSSVVEFNKWIWRRLRTIPSNAELRALYADFDSIGRSLPYESDAGTFIGILSDHLINKSGRATRIIYLIDEVDRFAGMYFQGGKDRETAIDVLWQIRHTIAERRDIGIVFAGSSAAKQLFINRAESPFYNSIDHLELTPFATKTKQQEEYARKIVEPTKIRGLYKLPKESLDHIVWVCAGIPYYMKLVSGATFSRAKQSHILISDVNEGLRALLSRETGIGKLDDMGGEPGSDDLRTIVGVEKVSDGILAKAVLYAFADIHSPLAGNRTYRGKISSSESKLVSTYNISKPLIEKGLDICLDLGLLKIFDGGSAPELGFSIPLLGESIRKASQRLWATIDHELVEIASIGDTQ